MRTLSDAAARTAIGVVSALLLAAASGCAAQDGPSGTTNDEDITASRNEDIQVLKVYDGPGFGVAKDASNGQIPVEDCKPEGTTWPALKAHDVETSGYITVTLDCTEAAAKKLGVAPLRPVKVKGSRTKHADESYYGYVSFSNGAGGFWSKTVELVVKQSAIDAATMNGIGFYLNTFTFAYYKAPPAPAENNGNANFLFADQVRALANTYPATTLASGESARVIKVLLTSEYETGGSSSIPGFYFRPFIEYVNGAEKVQRWDSVASDYFVRRSTTFNREHDILAH